MSEVIYQKKTGETIQLLTETSIADSLFPIGFSFVSSNTKTPSFGKWSIETVQFCIYQHFTNVTGSRDLFIITRTA